MCVNLDAEVMTLYPKKPITTLVRIGWSQDDSASDYLCSTPRSLMKAEDKYEVVLWFSIAFSWWARGTRESIIAERVWWWNRYLGRNSIVVERMYPYSFAPEISLEMTEMLEIIVED